MEATLTTRPALPRRRAAVLVLALASLACAPDKWLASRAATAGVG
jgi:hypothetical protein